MAVNLEEIPLPADIKWTDEFTGHGVGQEITPTLTGALVVEEFAQTVGRSITLSSDGAAWVRRGIVEQLQTLAATPLTDGSPLTLEWGDGRTFNVVFDRSQSNPVEAEEVMRLAADAQSSDHFYLVTIRLITA